MIRREVITAAPQGVGQLVVAVLIVAVSLAGIGVLTGLRLAHRPVACPVVEPEHLHIGYHGYGTTPTYRDVSIFDGSTVTLSNSVLTDSHTIRGNLTTLGNGDIVTADDLLSTSTERR